MEKIIIEFSESNIEFKNLIVELYGEKIENEFITTNKFNGDLVDVLISIVIPVVVPFLAVAFDKSLDSKKDEAKSNTKKVTFIKDGKEIVFENYDIKELKSILKNNLKQLQNSNE